MAKTTKNNATVSQEEFVKRLNDAIKDMKISKKLFKGVNLNTGDTNYIRDLVRNYYTMQGNRIRTSNQASALERSEKNNDIMNFFTEQLVVLEENINTFMDVYTKQHPIGIWLRSIYGIGPVIAAGLLSTFDVTKTKTAGGFWKYVGWEGGTTRQERKRGEKINYNPTARTLAWKAGHSFKMGWKKESNIYGQMYAQKKEFYIEKNEDGGFAENAKRELDNKKYSKDSIAGKTYREGKLPANHIDAMAQRFAAKMFLSHLFDVMYMYEYGTQPPVPYVEHIGHVHIDPPPKLDVIKPFLVKKWPDSDWDEILKYKHRNTKNNLKTLD